MNEQIMKLAKEVAAIEGWGPEVWQTTFTEKFAEMIVRECAEIVTIWSDEEPCSEGYDIIPVYKIKQRFGIE